MITKSNIIKDNEYEILLGVQFGQTSLTQPGIWASLGDHF